MMFSKKRRQFLCGSVVLPFALTQTLHANNIVDLSLPKEKGGSDNSFDKAEKDIFSIIAENKKMKIFARCLKKTAIDKMLADQEGSYTVFVSNDIAYRKISYGRKFAVWTNKKLMAEILHFHIVKGVWTIEDLQEVTKIPSMKGPEIDISQTENGLLISGASLNEQNIQASNGIIHVLDKVILPPKNTA